MCVVSSCQQQKNEAKAEVAKVAVQAGEVSPHQGAVMTYRCPYTGSSCSSDSSATSGH